MWKEPASRSCRVSPPISSSTIPPHTGLVSSISSGSICLNVPGALLNLLQSRPIYSARG